MLAVHGDELAVQSQAIEMREQLVAQRICSREHNAARRRFVELYARWRDAEELIALGTYHPGADRRTDEAVALHEKLDCFLTQDADEIVPLESSAHQLAEAIA